MKFFNHVPNHYKKFSLQDIPHVLYKFQKYSSNQIEGYTPLYKK